MQCFVVFNQFLAQANWNSPQGIRLRVFHFSPMGATAPNCLFISSYPVHLSLGTEIEC